MPPEREDDGFDGKHNKTPTLRPPLYNAEDYSVALKQLFSSTHHANHHNNAYRHQNTNPNGGSTMLIEHSSNTGAAEMNPSQNPNSSSSSNRQPEMGMKKFLNGSELLFKLEADLRHAYPSFVQEFVSGQFEGIAALLEALKTIQAALEDVSGLREQRKMLMDEQKCLYCIKLALRNIEAVSKLVAYSGGLYPLAAAMVSTVTATRIIAFEVLTCVCSEGGGDGHYKVCEALSTLRLRVGEPLRCKLIVGAISSAPPGTFQAKGIKFLTSFISSAPDPKHKVHIQCELEEAGFNAGVLRKGAELGGARESREVHIELDEWERVIIDVDTLTRQNCQLRNSVATLQQELATLKDKMKRMDGPGKSDESRKRGTRGKRSSSDQEAAISTPVDSEEEAEQIHQILEDLNNIVNSEMRVQQKSAAAAAGKKEQEIVPVHLVKSPPKKKLSSSTPVLPRPWPGSSASDDDDSDIVEMLEKGGGGGGESRNNNNHDSKKPNVLRVVQQLENMEKTAPKHFRDKHQKLQNLPISMSKSISPINEPRPDYSLPNFLKANQMARKFENFKSAKLYSSSPDNSGDSRSSSKNNVSSGYAEVYEKSTNGSPTSSGKYNISPRFSPNLELPVSDHNKKRSNGGGSNNNHSKSQNNPQHHHNHHRNSGSGGLSPPGLRRSESLHASLASIEVMPHKDNKNVFYPHQQHGMMMGRQHEAGGHGHGRSGGDKWKSMESLEKGRDENFTLRWKYPHPHDQQQQSKKSSKKSAQQQQHHHDPNNVLSSTTPSPKSGSKTAKLAAKNLLGQGHNKGPAIVPQPQGGGELCADYRQNRFTKNSGKTGGERESSSRSSPLNIFARYSKKSSPEKEKSLPPLHHVGPHHHHGPTSYIQVQQGQPLPSGSAGSQHHHHNNHNDFNQKEKENMKMYSLPPIMMPHALDNHRLADLPSGLY